LSKKANCNGYFGISVHASGPQEIRGKQQLHRVVAFLFRNTELEAKIAATGLSFRQLDVDHINGDEGDTRAENLQFLTKAEHAQKSVGRAVSELRDPDSAEEIARFPTTTAAAMAIGIHLPLLSYHLCRTKIATTTCNGVDRYFCFSSVLEDRISSNRVPDTDSMDTK